MLLGQNKRKNYNTEKTTPFLNSQVFVVNFHVNMKTLQ